jgi:Mrp family chromosome partitioning ATPase
MSDRGKKDTAPGMGTPPQSTLPMGTTVSTSKTTTLPGTQVAAAAAAAAALPRPAAQIVEDSPPPVAGEPVTTKVWVATHEVPADPDERLVMVTGPDSERAAAMRVLRHRLQAEGDPRTVVVTSPGRGEGKTTVAANLALAMSECGRAKVLLVEANLRQPALAALFGFMPPECFSVQLERHREKPADPWSVVEVYSPFLHVLAVAPRVEGRPLVDAPAFHAAIAQLRRSRYDYIVIDTPPVLGTADVNLVEDAADAVLFVARSGATEARALKLAIEQLSPAKIAGVMLLDT